MCKQNYNKILILKEERETTTDALLKLLEDACIKIDKNFRSISFKYIE